MNEYKYSRFYDVHCMYASLCANLQFCTFGTDVCAKLVGLTFSSHLCQGSWFLHDALSRPFDASSCNLSETQATPVLVLLRYANACRHMVAGCLTLVGQ